MIQKIREAILNGESSVSLSDSEIRRIKAQYTFLDSNNQKNVDKHSWLCVNESETHVGQPRRVIYICIADKLWRGETLGEFVRRTGCYD